MLDIYNVLQLINMNVLNSKMLLLLVHLDVPFLFFPKSWFKNNCTKKKERLVHKQIR